MPITNAARDLIADLITGLSSPTDFSAANAHVGVGDSTTAFANTQTDLQASTNKLRVAMDSGYPDQSQGANVMRFKSTFSTSQANFAWAEWGIFNAASTGTMLSRKVEALGTKTSAQTWVMTADLTITVA